MTADQVFEMILNDPYLWGRTGLSEGRRYYFRYWHKKGKYISDKKKLELILATGIKETRLFSWQGKVL